MGYCEAVIKYNSDKDSIELNFKYDYEKVSSLEFANKKPEIKEVWIAINNMESNGVGKFIDKLYEHYKRTGDVIEVLLFYSQKCLNNVAVETRRICEEALYYGMEYNRVRLLDDKEEALKCHLAEKIWHIVEEESFFSEKAEELYRKNPKMRIMIQDRYYW